MSVGDAFLYNRYEERWLTSNLVSNDFEDREAHD